MTTFRDKAEAPSKRSTYKHTFVEILPEALDNGVLYVCIQYATSAHKCFCGCGREVVTPIHPTKWKLTFDGVHVSLFPSVGSWSLPCESHYWLKSGRVMWAAKMSEDKIQAVRSRDLAAQDSFFKKKGEKPDEIGATEPNLKSTSRRRGLADWFKGK